MILVEIRCRIGNCRNKVAIVRAWPGGRLFVESERKRNGRLHFRRSEITQTVKDDLHGAWIWPCPKHYQRTDPDGVIVRAGDYRTRKPGSVRQVWQVLMPLAPLRPAIERARRTGHRQEMPI